MYNARDLKMEYLVLKLKDINTYLSNEEQEQFWLLVFNMFSCREETKKEKKNAK